MHKYTLARCILQISRYYNTTSAWHAHYLDYAPCCIYASVSTSACMHVSLYVYIIVQRARLMQCTRTYSMPGMHDMIVICLQIIMLVITYNMHRACILFFTLQHYSTLSTSRYVLWRLKNCYTLSPTTLDTYKLSSSDPALLLPPLLKTQLASNIIYIKNNEDEGPFARLTQMNYMYALENA